MDKKVRYKMYKAGRKWVVAALVFTSVGTVTVVTTRANADTNSKITKKVSVKHKKSKKVKATTNTVVPKNLSFVNLANSKMTVYLSDKFPTVYGYKFENGKEFKATQQQLTTIKIDDKEYTPTVSYNKSGDNQIIYTITINDVAKFDVVATLSEETFGFKVQNLTELGDRIHTLAIPGLEMASLDTDETDASFAGMKMYTATSSSTNGQTGDTFKTLAKQGVDKENYRYGFLNNHDVAVGLWTNAAQDGNDKSEDNKIILNTQSINGKNNTGMESNYFTIRAKDDDTSKLSDDMLDMPEWKVAFAFDENNDGKVDWQDGAIAYRQIMNNPYGWQDTKRVVVQRIPMNFASQATNPFLMTLDETKRVAAITDGLGQTVLLKGYQNEGHDSAHPDYDAIGQRQGGVQDFNELIDAGHKLNASFGVHINATEAYPEAKAFNEQLVDINSKGWDWLDPSYYINQRYDALSGNRYNRLKSLKQEAPNLDFIYVDVWGNQTEGGWESRRLASEINSLGWKLHNEFPSALEYDSLWNHWSAEKAYGGSSTKGINSNIERFIRNNQKDSWIIANNSLLGGAKFEAYEGWVGKTSFDIFVDVTYRTDLPTKFLQHFNIMNWNANWDNTKKDYVGSISFDHDVKVDNSSGTKVITLDGIPVLNDKLTYGGSETGHNVSMLLPWDSSDEVGNGVKSGTKDTDGLNYDKMYYWNDQDGQTTWKLTDKFKNASSLHVYKLTDQGRVDQGTVDVKDGSVTLNLAKQTPYVLTVAAEKSEEITFGEGTHLKDPGFNAKDTLKNNWQITSGNPSVEKNDTGDYLLNAGSEKLSMTQELTDLAAGKYSFYVNTQTNNRPVTLTVDVDGKKYTRSFEDSIVQNYIQADSNHTKGYQEQTKSYMQKARIDFEVPSNAKAVSITLAADVSTEQILFDDLRVVKRSGNLQEGSVDADGNTIIISQDFEDAGAISLYPFFKGPAGGVEDPRVHLSQRHDKYTQYGWNGNKIDDALDGDWSLKAHKQASGLMYVTDPQSVKFESGKTYKIEFDYQTDGASQYHPVIMNGETAQTIYDGLAKTSGDLSTNDLSKNHTKHVSYLVTAGDNASHMGFGIQNDGGDTDFVLDNFKVTQIAEKNIDTEQKQIARDNLQSQIDAVKALDKSQYTNGSYKNLVAVLEDAQKVVANENATLNELQTRLTKLQEAQKKLILVEDTKYISNSKIKPINEYGNSSTGETIDKAFDGDPNTMWHTDYSLTTTTQQRTVEMDLDKDYELNGFVYVPRASGKNGLITEYEIQIPDTIKATDQWKTIAKGTWTGNNSVKTVNFDPVTTNKIRLVPVHTIGDAADKFASAAEFKLMINRTAPSLSLKQNAVDLPTNTDLSSVDWNQYFEYNDSIDGAVYDDLQVDTSKVDIKTPGKYEVTLTATNTAGLTAQQKLTVNVKASSTQDDAQKYPPVAQEITVNVGAKIDLADIITNQGSFPAGTTVSWLKEIETTTPGVKEGSVQIAYPDGSKTTLTVKVAVLANQAGPTLAQQYEPQGINLVVTQGQALDATQAIKNKDKLPANTKFAWKQAIDSQKLGTSETTVIVTYADGSIDEVNVKVQVVKATTKPSTENKDQTGSKKQVNKNNLPQTGEATNNLVEIGGLIVTAAIGCLAWFKKFF